MASRLLHAFHGMQPDCKPEFKKSEPMSGRLLQRVTRALCQIGFSAVSQNEFAAVFPQGNGNLPAIFASVFPDVAGLYSGSDVKVY